MADKLLKKRVIAIKQEATAGTAETPGTTDAEGNFYNARIVPQIEVIQRMSQGTFSPMSSVRGSYIGQVTFQTHLSGGSTIPETFETLLPASGFVKSTRTFGPRSEAPGSNVKTVTISLYEDGLLKKLRGAVGNPIFTFEAGKPVIIDWTFTGIWVASPTDTSIIAPTYPSETPIRVANSNMLIGSWAPKVSRWTLDFGNEITVVQDSDSADASGLKYAVITGRRINGRIDPESEAVATAPVYTQLLAGTEAAWGFDFLVGTNDGIVFAAPKFQINTASVGDREGIQVDELEYQLNRSSAAGNDELTIEFDTA